jgi:hypothetical protein
MLEEIMEFCGKTMMNAFATILVTILAFIVLSLFFAELLVGILVFGIFILLAEAVLYGAAVTLLLPIIEERKWYREKFKIFVYLPFTPIFWLSVTAWCNNHQCYI